MKMTALNFTNLSISKKLGLAFGLVLLLNLIVMFTGLRSTEKMVASGDDLSRLNDMELLLLDAQVSVERFIASGAPVEAEKLQRLIVNMDQQLKTNIFYFNNPAEQQSLRDIQKSLDGYSKSLDDLIQAQARRDTARSKMISSGNETLSSIETLQKSGFSKLSDDKENIGLLKRVQQVSLLNQSLLNIRYLVRGYVFQQTGESEKIADKALNELNENLRQLIAESPKEEHESLNNTGLILSRYQAGYRLFSQGVSDTKSAAKSLSEYGSAMRLAGSQLRQEQLAQRTSVASAAKRSLIGTSLVSIVLAVLAAWIITAQIVKPLRNILHISSSIAKGDLRATLSSTRKDELGQLERSINDMAQSLRQLIGFIGDGVIQIAGAAGQLSIATGETNIGVTRQRVETDQVATAMHEMTHTVRDVARNAEEASVAATQADTEAKKGDQKLKEAVHEMDNLSSEVSLCATSVQALQGECLQITGVLSVIKSLAEQTNLLALNAAIEAARAGQAGSGFAVVADEVRALAQRTQKAATEIDSLVGSLLKGATAATDFMSRSRTMASRTLGLGREAGISLGTISQTVSVMQAMNLQIAAAAEQQSAVAEQINSSIYEVRAISEMTAKSSDDTATSSAVLASLGSELQQYVQRFQV
jgi:methyl-accepting chemotaxis protein